MTVLVVDKDWSALRGAADAITQRNAAVTVMLRSNEAAAAQFAMCNPVDIVFLRAGPRSGWLMQKIKDFQPLAEFHILEAGQELTHFLVPYVRS